MPAFQNLAWDVRDHLAFITINRPRALNALDRATMLEIEAAAEELSRPANGIRAAILTGAGDKAFAAGADISELAAFGTAEAHEGSSRGFEL